jgi:phage major head subunit gpT-like protein
MDLNRENLDTVFRGLRSDFNGAYRNGEDATADALATTVQSSTASERFDWLGDDPEMREWLGPRHLNQFKSFKYEVFPKDFEVTCRVQRNDVKDDRIGIYSLQAAQGGQAARLLKPREVANALDSGTVGLCYDGQPFFDTQHPVGEDGDIDLVSNYLNEGGASASSPWYLIDTSRVVKPIVVVDREKPTFSAFADYSNLHTFMHREFLYGAQARLGTGYGLWQTCFRNEAALNITNLRATRLAMQDLRSDRKNEAGRRKKLGIKPNLLVCGASNEDAAIASIKSAVVNSLTDPFAVSASTTVNPLHNAFTILVVSWLP